MAVFYLDTSAIVKRYRNEIGTEVVDELLERPLAEDRFFISLFSVLEMTSRFTRLVKGNELSEKEGVEALARFERDVQERFRVYPHLDEVAFQEAVLAAEEHGLRAGDAIHLATAKRLFALAPGLELVMVASDRELLDAAQAEGYTTLDPQDARALETLHQIRSSGHRPV